MAEERLDHYVQEALFRYWSSLNAEGRPDNMVVFYDFDDHCLHRDNSRNVFAKRGLNDQTTERRLNQLVEQPLAKFRQKEIRRRRTGQVQSPIDLDEKTQRALALVFYVQTCRSSDADDFGVLCKESRLARLLASSEAELDWYAKSFLDENQILTAGMGNHRLCFPEVGYFGIPITRPGARPAAALALPLLPNLAFLAVPRGVTLDWRDYERVAAISSIGVRSSRRVIVPPHAVASQPEDVLAAEMEGLRAAVEETLSQISEACRLLDHGMR